MQEMQGKHALQILQLSKALDDAGVNASIRFKDENMEMPRIVVDVPNHALISFAGGTWDEAVADASMYVSRVLEASRAYHNAIGNAWQGEGVIE